jgi:hypothetical protein
MGSRDPITSAFAPDLEEIRAWLQKMIAALRFVDLVTAVVALLGRMRDINTELVSQLAHLRSLSTKLRHPVHEFTEQRCLSRPPARAC